MLNVSAKEFVPAASPKMAAAIPTSLSKDSTICGPSMKDPLHNGHMESDTVCSGHGVSAPIKAQLSPMAPAFVPRGCGKADGKVNSCLLDTASDPPRSVLTPPRSDSTLSSSFASPELEGLVGAEAEWYSEEQAAQVMTYDRVSGRYCYYFPTTGPQDSEEQYEDCGGYGVAPAVAQGGELAPGDDSASGCMYDPYGYSVYDGYTMPYTDADVDTLGATVYYDTQYAAYDGLRQYDSLYTQGGAYYWDESAGAYVYNEPQQYVSGEYRGWQSMSPPFQCENVPGPAARAATAVAWVSASGNDVDANPDAEGPTDVDAELCLGGGDRLRSLEPSEAAELLEMFFPHYAGEALSRLLQRTGGDLLAAFSELAAMERQVGAERAVAGNGSGSGKGGHPHPRSGGKGAKGPAGRSHVRRSGGGAGAFKLDLESFPLLPPSPSPQLAAKTSPPPSAATPDPDANDSIACPPLPPAEAVGNWADEVPEADAAPVEPLSATTTLATTVSGPASSAAVGASPSPKPNFAAMLRNSHSAPTAVSSPAPRRPDAANSGGCSSSAGYRNGGGKAQRGCRGGTAVTVPWVSTGEAVAAQYAEERQEAAMLARARNQCFQQATMAYLSGNKALAKQLGRRGRELNEAMKTAHAAAARRIFAQRNSRAAAAGGNHGSGHHKFRHAESRRQQQQHQAKHSQHHQAVKAPSSAVEAIFVDLHGLHAAEAVALLESQIEGARAAGCRTLRVCTGTGHHTKGAKTPARLPAAVADALLSNHLTFKTLKPGLLEAQL